MPILEKNRIDEAKRKIVYRIEGREQNVVLYEIWWPDACQETRLKGIGRKAFCRSFAPFQTRSSMEESPGRYAIHAAQGSYILHSQGRARHFSDYPDHLLQLKFLESNHRLQYNTGLGIIVKKFLYVLFLACKSCLWFFLIQQDYLHLPHVRRQGLWRIGRQGFALSIEGLHLCWIYLFPRRLQAQDSWFYADPFENPDSSWIL